MANQKDRVRFNVGGKIFETTTTTLAIAGRESYFGAMFDDNWDLQMNPAGEHFIDRNPICFSILLDLLRSGELHIPPNIPEKLLYREALFYGLMDHVRSAKSGPFDGNLLQPTKTVTGWAPDGTAIRASPDGGCCVARGSMANIYDWTLEQHHTINLDYQWVKDAGWIGSMDPTGLVISTCGLLESRGEGQGGVRLFNSTTGELKHKFNVTHEDVVKTYSAGALSFSDGCNLFSSCSGSSNEDGIGVWDQNTGQQVDFFYEPPGWSLGDADKLQWLNGLNCLLVVNLFGPRRDDSYISLLDFRSKSMVWSWSDKLPPSYTSSSWPRSDYQRVCCAIAIEENSSICVADTFENLGFLELMRDRGSVRWNSQRGSGPGDPKLALHEGQLFLSRNDSISVFRGPGSDWILTSRLRRGLGTICDFSIGGDRLFALHKDENVFDVWETPPSYKKPACETKP